LKNKIALASNYLQFNEDKKGYNRYYRFFDRVFDFMFGMFRLFTPLILGFFIFIQFFNDDYKQDNIHGVQW